MTLLVVEHLSKSYGGVHAVRDVSFALERGELYLLRPRYELAQAGADA